MIARCLTRAHGHRFNLGWEYVEVMALEWVKRKEADGVSGLMVLVG